MDFYQVLDIDNDFCEGNFSVQEPKSCNLPFFSTQPFICITPGVVFDKSCNRMGFGRGFYDRFFYNHKSAIKIGLSYDNQLDNNIVVHDHDVVLDYVITETTIFSRG